MFWNLWVQLVCCNRKQLRPWVPHCNLNFQSPILCGISICSIHGHSEEHCPREFVLDSFHRQGHNRSGRDQGSSSEFSFSKWQVRTGASISTVFDTKISVAWIFLAFQTLTWQQIHLDPVDTQSLVFLAVSSKSLTFPASC